MMVCGNVLGKAKTTKVGMVWYEFNIVNESINESVTKVGIELLGQLKKLRKKNTAQLFFSVTIRSRSDVDHSLTLLSLTHC